VTLLSGGYTLISPNRYYGKYIHYQKLPANNVITLHPINLYLIYPGGNSGIPPLGGKMKKFLILLGVSSLAVCPTASAAQSTTASDSDPQAFCSNLFKAKCGLLVGMAVNVGRSTAKNASVVGDLVRVSSNDDLKLAGMGYINYPFELKNGYKIGPYFGVGTPTSGGETFSYGGGLLFNLPKKETRAYGLAIGLGVLFSPGVQVLGDGIIEGKLLPKGETQVRYKNITGTSLNFGVGVTF
jgi:hypothetical protein